MWLPAWSVFMMYYTVQVLNHTAQQCAEFTEFHRWINSFWAGGPDSSRPPPLSLYCLWRWIRGR